MKAPIIILLIFGFTVAVVVYGLPRLSLIAKGIPVNKAYYFTLTIIYLCVLVSVITEILSESPTRGAIAGIILWALMTSFFRKIRAEGVNDSREELRPTDFIEPMHKK